jgi:hypothetical protein
MGRTLQLVVLVALIEMSAVALGVGVWRWNALGDLSVLTAAQRGRWWTGTLMMGFFPAWVALGAWIWTRQRRRSGLRFADDTRRHQQVTWLAAVALAVGVQLWLAGTMLGLVPKAQIGVRLVEALAGVFIMVAANFGAKTSPPTGAGAPDPAAWTRGMLRIGWAGVVAGLVIVVASITVAISQMVWIIFAACAANIAFAVWQGRAMRRRPA